MNYDVYCRHNLSRPWMETSQCAGWDNIKVYVPHPVHLRLWIFHKTRDCEDYIAVHLRCALDAFRHFYLSRPCSHADACVIKSSKEKEFNTTRPTANKASSSSSDYSSLVSLPRYVETVAVQADIATSSSSSTQSLVPEETVESVQISQPERELRHRGAVVSSLFKRDSWHVMAENPEEEEGSACHGITPGTYNEKSTQADLSKIDLPREKKPLVSRDPIGQECSDIALRYRDSVCRFTLKQSNIAPVPSAHGLQGSQSVFPLPCTAMQSHATLENHETTSGVSDANNDLLNLKRGHCLHVITHRVYPPFKLGESPVEPSSKTTLPSLKYTTDSGFGSEQTLPVIPEPLPTQRQQQPYETYILSLAINITTSKHCSEVVNLSSSTTINQPFHYKFFMVSITQTKIITHLLL
ncbi:unnamed protein product [Clavelina lepadiformis]|uniref:Uncharacterized protein n=1 Tax=Clavelina lepadiformis TaxID=159417 RepID=A0ABP0GT90_CLALP